MASLNLSEREVELVKKSINHCLQTCENKEIESECTDCEALKTVLVKLSQTNS